MKRILLLFTTIICLQASAKSPFIMFSAFWDGEAIKIITENLRSTDYVSNAFFSTVSQKEKFRINLFSLPPSLKGVQRWASQPCTNSNWKQTIIYDPEHWKFTPPEEILNLDSSLETAKKLVSTNGCSELGFAPDGRLLGVDPGSCTGKIGNEIKNVDWSRISIFIMQGQALLSKRCGGDGNIASFLSFIKLLRTHINERNPNTAFVASLSFNVSKPEIMIKAVQMTAQWVDGFYLAYPDVNISQKCNYCNAENLSIVLKAIKSIDQ